MRATLFVALGLVAAVLGKCGEERWPVKTGTDDDAHSVVTKAKTTTISEMCNLDQPDKRPQSNRIKPTEEQVFKITTTLTGYKREADEDYHLVITDADGNTMIVEIPNPDCVGDASLFGKQIANARAQFDAVFDVSGSMKKTNTKVVVTGIGFFDQIHGQDGVAPNGVELHPVLDIQISSTENNLTETRAWSKAQNSLLVEEEPAPSSAESSDRSEDEKDSSEEEEAATISEDAEAARISEDEDVVKSSEDEEAAKSSEDDEASKASEDKEAVKSSEEEASPSMPDTKEEGASTWPLRIKQTTGSFFGIKW